MMTCPLSPTKSCRLLTLLFVLFSLPPPVHAGDGMGGDFFGRSSSCFATVRYDQYCNDEGLDGMTQDELAQHVGQPIHTKNAAGCWHYGTVQYNPRKQLYTFDMTGHEFFDRADCSVLRGTDVRYCAGTCDDGDSNRRRVLKGQEADGSSSASSSFLLLQPGDDAYEEYKEECRDLEYAVSLVIVDAHFYAVAVPIMADSATNNCPSFVTEANFNYQPKDTATPDSAHRPAPYRKELRVLDLGQQTTKSSFLDHEDTYHIGTYPLSDLVRAHESVDPSSSKTSQQFASITMGYDIIGQNCADYMLELASALDYPVDSKLATFVVRRLVQDAGHDLANKIRSSLHFGSLFSNNSHRRLRNHQLISDEEVILALVENKRAAHAAV